MKILHTDTGKKMRYKVKDGPRTLIFEGKELAHASSFYPGKFRWIEFTIFKTNAGQYVVSRTGRSYIFHRENCPTVQRNRIAPLPGQVIPDDMQPCDLCNPDRVHDEILYPETPREAATSCSSADGVVKWMRQKDSNGIDYLTNVAKDALELAAETDIALNDAYYTERVY